LETEESHAWLIQRCLRRLHQNCGRPTLCDKSQNSWVISLRFTSFRFIGNITETVRIWSEYWTWLPWVSGIAILILTITITGLLIYKEDPFDFLDYAKVSVKSVGVALLLALIWNLFFSQVTGGSAAFVLCNVGIAAGWVLVKAVKDELWP
jgi:hypothetical protein